MSGFGILILVIVIYAITCYAFFFLYSGLKLLYRKLTNESRKWTFKDAIRSWGFDCDYEMTTEKEKELGITRYWTDEFSWGFFAFMFFISPFMFFYFVFMILLRLIISPILYFLGEN